MKQNILTLVPLLHVDLDKVPDVDRIANKLPFVVRLANQMQNMSMPIQFHKNQHFYAFYLQQINNFICRYLICIIFGKKYNFYVACFTNECLWLFSFTAKHSRFTSIRYIGFSISINNLKTIKFKTFSYENEIFIRSMNILLEQT